MLARRLDALSGAAPLYARLHPSPACSRRCARCCQPPRLPHLRRARRPQAAPRDRAVILRAVREATRRNPVANRSLFQFIEDVLLLRDPDGVDAAATEARRDFVPRAQQLMA